MPSEPEDLGRGHRDRLSSGRVLVRSSAFTLGGRVAQILAGVLAVPLLISQLGPARFGVLTLVWATVGYASIFDLGLGRALTKLTAEKLGKGLEHEIPALFWTALRLLAGFGILGGATVAVVSPWLVGDVLNIPAELDGEARLTFLLVAATIPFVLISASLRGSLEARQRFDLTNSIAVPLAVLSYFGPVLISLFTNNLAAAVCAVVLSRIVATVINLILCLRIDPNLHRDRTFNRALVGPLLRFGGWVTLASVASPLMLTLDRFVIGGVVSATAVAYYAVPYEAAKQLLVVSASVSLVLFPAFSVTVGSDAQRAERLLGRGASAVLVSLFPLTLGVVVFAEEILRVWVGTEFADNGTRVMQWFAAGILMNGLAFVAFGMLQSTRPDLIAKLLFAELPFYLLSLWLLLGEVGLVGAAIAWTGRVTLDAAALYLILHRLKLVGIGKVKAIAVPAAAALATFFVGAQVTSLPAKVIFFLSVLFAFGLLAWSLVLEPADRSRLRQRLNLAHIGA